MTLSALQERAVAPASDLRPLKAARRAKIVCTLGPATDSPEAVAELVAAGMDVARLDLSHGTHADHAVAYHRVRAASDAAGHAVGVLADLQGPKLTAARSNAVSCEGARSVITAASTSPVSRSARQR